MNVIDQYFRNSETEHADSTPKDLPYQVSIGKYQCRVLLMMHRGLSSPKRAVLYLEPNLKHEKVRKMLF